MTALKPRRRSIRFAIVAVVCLLLGAVTTVGVAWGFQLLCRTGVQRYNGLQAAAFQWPSWTIGTREPPDAGILQSNAGWSSTTLMYEHELYGIFVPDRAGTTTVRSGFPVTALRSEYVDHDRAHKYTRFGIEFVSWRSGLSVTADTSQMPGRWLLFYSRVKPLIGSGMKPQGSSAWFGQMYLPLRPEWPGFALDTALYASAWYLLLFTLPLIRAGRRRFRVSRGMCGSCGYDLNASTNRPCPECGKALTA